MQHLKWKKHGRLYSLADEGRPNELRLEIPNGMENVDVHGDGSEFAPYVVDAATLRHGDSECNFADGYQNVKRLGQVVVSRSRLFVQRLVSGSWTDVPHGIPTRGMRPGEAFRDGQWVADERRCTAFLDFPEIQGYAQGARLQIGIEAGGSRQEIYGFRFRSPVAGTFRLEWVLDIPEDVELAWITNRDDARIGARIGKVRIRWSKDEIPYRSATVENDGQGGRVVHIFLGPYTLAAMEWLTVYPDTLGPEDAGWGCDVDSSGAKYEDYGEDMCGGYSGKVNRVANKFDITDLPADDTVTQVDFGIYVSGGAGAIFLYWDIDGYNGTGQGNPETDSGANMYSRCNVAGVYVNDTTSFRTTGAKTFTFASQANSDVEAARDAGTIFSVAIRETDDFTGNYRCEFREYTHRTTPPTLTITYTEAGGATVSSTRGGNNLGIMKGMSRMMALGTSWNRPLGGI